MANPSRASTHRRFRRQQFYNRVGTRVSRMARKARHMGTRVSRALGGR
jgi:hypothetical protein